MSAQLERDTGSAAYNACLEALVRGHLRLRATRGKVAVLYQGESRSGRVWKTLEVRQADYLKRMGVAAPYEVITDALERIGVRVGGREVSLRHAMEATHGFEAGESEDLWAHASALWSQNNDRIFVWAGSSLKTSTLLRDIELPIQYRKKHLSKYTTAQLAKAQEQLRRHEPLEADMREAEPLFFAYFERLAKRRKWLMKYKWIDRWSNLSH